MNKHYSNFVNAVNNKDVKEANWSLMRRLGETLADDRHNFIELLNESGVPATADMSDEFIAELYINNIDTNRDLALGTALLVSEENKVLSFDGGEEFDDNSVKSAYAVLRKYYDEEYSYLDPVTAIAGAIGAGANLGSTITEAKQRKKYGMMDALQKKSDAKSQMLQSFLAQKQQQAQAALERFKEDKKAKRTAMIIGGVLIVGALVGIILMSRRKRRNG
jgi:hypothetical protein